MRHPTPLLDTVKFPLHHSTCAEYSGQTVTVFTVMHCFVLASLSLSGTPCMAAGCSCVRAVLEWDLIQVEYSLQHSINRGYGQALWAFWHPYKSNIMPNCEVLLFVLTLSPLARAVTTMQESELCFTVLRVPIKVTHSDVPVLKYLSRSILTSLKAIIQSLAILS